MTVGPTDDELRLANIAFRGILRDVRRDPKYNQTIAYWDQVFTLLREKPEIKEQLIADGVFDREWIEERLRLAECNGEEE